MDFRAQLRKQLRFIDRSCIEFDRGDRDEAVRIATAVSALCHDTASSVSVLMHMGKKGISLRSTNRKYPPEWDHWPAPSITSIKLHPQTNVLECVPLFERGGAGRQIPLSEWWLETISKRNHDEARRRDVIQAARNTDGGGHVDASHPVKYNQLMDGSGFKMVIGPSTDQELTLDLSNIHLSTLRQIGHEILTSPDILTLADYRPESLGLILPESSGLHDTSSHTLEDGPIFLTFGQPH